MKKIFLLFFLCSAVSAEDKPLPVDFLDFYKDFRSAVIAKNYDAVVHMTCFPFKAFDNTETLGRVAYNKKLRSVERNIFVKNNLAKYFLTRAGDISGDEPIVVNGLANTIPYLYKNYEQIIVENEDPQMLKRLPANSSRYSAENGAAFINDMEFKKTKAGWCWSYASYMRDEKDKW